MKVDVFVKLIPMKTVKVRECVTTNEDGTYTIFIEASLSSFEMIEAYNHAICHICNNDFNKLDADRIEFISHCG